MGVHRHAADLAHLIYAGGHLWTEEDHHVDHQMVEGFAPLQIKEAVNDAPLMIEDDVALGHFIHVDQDRIHGKYKNIKKYKMKLA